MNDISSVKEPTSKPLDELSRDSALINFLNEYLSDPTYMKIQDLHEVTPKSQFYQKYLEGYAGYGGTLT